jgi:hypothetical protein
MTVVIGAPRRLRPEVEARIVALLKRGFSPAEAVTAMAEKGIGVNRVMAARDRAGLGPYAQARAALEARVRHLSPEECRAYQRELEARDAAKAAALASPAPRPPAPPVRQRRLEETRPELERREEAIDEAAPDSIDAATGENDEAFGRPTEHGGEDGYEDLEDEAEPELETKALAVIGADLAVNDAAPEVAPEETATMETAKEPVANPAEQLNSVLAEIANLDELSATMAKKRDELAARAVGLAATIEDLARKAREVATGVPPPTEPAKPRTCTGWPGAPKGKAYTCDRPGEVCEDCHGPAALAAENGPKAALPKLGGRLARVYRLVAKAGAMRAREVQEAIGANPSNLLRSLVESGHLVKAERGLYRAA